MSWLLSGQLQSSLGSLKSQVASSLKEVFEAVDEDEQDDLDLDNPNQDPLEKIELARRRIRELKDSLEDKKSDVEKFRKQNEALSQQRKFFEEQREQQCEQFKELLKDKEEEIQILIREKEKHPQQLDEEEISLLNNQIESLQNCLIEVKEKHRKDIEDLTKSFLAQKSIQNGAPESSDEGEKEQLRVQVEALQKCLDEERVRHKIQIENLETSTLLKSEAHPENFQNGGTTSNLSQEEKSHFESEIQLLQQTLSREREKQREEIEGSVFKLQERDSEIKHLKEKVQDSEKLQLEIESLQNALFDEKSKYKKHVQNSRSEVDELKKQFQIEIDHLRENVGRLQEENRIATQARLEVENILSGERDNQNRRIDEIGLSLATAEQERDQLRREVERLEEEVKLGGEAESDQVRTLQNSLKEEREKHEQKIAELSSKLKADHEEDKLLLQTDFQSKVDQMLKASETKLKEEILAKEREFEQVMAEKNHLETSTIPNLTSENARLSKTVEASEAINCLNKESQNKLQSLEEANLSLTNEISSLKDLSSEYFNEKEEIRNDKMLLENECSDLKEKLENLLKDFGDLKAELQSKESNDQNASLEAIELLERERDQEIRRLTDQLQDRENEIQRLMAEQERIVRDQEQLQNASSEDSSELQKFKAQVEFLQKCLNEGRVKHSQTIEELTGALQEQQRANKESQTQIESLTEMYESRVKTLELEISNNQDQLRLLTARSEELEGLNYDLSSKNKSLSKYEKEYENLHRADNELQDRLRIVEAQNVSLSTELVRLKSVEDKFSKVLSEKEKIFNEKLSLESECSKLKEKESKLLKDFEDLKTDIKNSDNNAALNQTIENLNACLSEFASKEQSWSAESDRLMAKIAECQQQQLQSNDQIEELSTMNQNLKLSFDEKCQDLEMAKRNLQELTIMLEEKNADTMSDQQHKLQSIAAIQELQSQLSQARRDRDASQSRMANLERELQELKREVNNVIEKKRKLEQELGRLKQHLVSIEESSTQDALANEDRERELRKKLQVTEEALRVASAQQSSANKEASTHVHVLEAKVHELSQEREKMVKKFQTLKIDLNKKSRALENLEMALAGLQEEKKNDVKMAEHAYNEMLSNERQRQAWLENEVKVLNQRVQKTDEVLAAASSLGEQIAAKNQIISGLKQEIKIKDELLQKAQEEFGDKAVNNARFERNLVKNLIVSYFQADTKQKSEVLALIAKVLGFNEEERIKTGLDGPGYGLRYLRSMIPGRAESEGKVDLSLAEAFVKFLETESTPKTPIRLPVEEMTEDASRRSRKSSASSSTTPSLDVSDAINSSSTVPKSGSPNPLVMAGNSGLSASAMPSLPTFSVNRSSSAILRHVLQEEEQ